MLEHPEEKMKDTLVKCNCCGWTRPTHYSKVKAIGDMPKKIRENKKK